MQIKKYMMILVIFFSILFLSPLTSIATGENPEKSNVVYTDEDEDPDLSWDYRCGTGWDDWLNSDWDTNCSSWTNRQYNELEPVEEVKIGHSEKNEDTVDSSPTNNSWLDDDNNLTTDYKTNIETNAKLAIKPNNNSDVVPDTKPSTNSNVSSDTKSISKLNNTPDTKTSSKPTTKLPIKSAKVDNSDINAKDSFVTSKQVYEKPNSIHINLKLGATKNNNSYKISSLHPTTGDSEMPVLPIVGGVLFAGSIFYLTKRKY
ncbi:LPXTG cell wall anchor domain-containing protein [Listeria seeligeri]|uniref:LPXTG cell wall anchor domain-containing protein n=1 Tax=Listeria seeligeri TaxID=1640 RepID=UPI001624AE78|nr:LPXTG cell wall anchor domain-containing protein [Listeria seeligeri]MBC1886550.1 LPXTG cell wall anchor domain-containing protein [Listeria seeligeri]QPJ27254.1 LPXTG cell wall anchor domain-containing protein [Listeria seeligeri]